MTDETENIINAFKQEADQLRDKNTQLSTALSNTSYQGMEGGNLIEFQLDTGDMLNKIEHFLKGDYVNTDKEGNEFWATPMKTIKEGEGDDAIDVEVIDTDLVLFNAYGVNSIMVIIGNYIDKNTILSSYTEMRINEILADLGDEMANFLYCNYEKMGMDTDFKKTRFILTVITILHSIESAYRRALNGQTREDLNSAKIFTQSDVIGNRSMPAPKKQGFFHWLKPR